MRELFKKTTAFLLAIVMVTASMNIAFADTEVIEIGDNGYSDDSVVSGCAIDTSNTNDSDISLMSLLPLEEVEAALVLNGYTEEQLKAVPLQEVLDKLVDNDGNKIEVSDDAKIVWGHFKDKEGNLVRDEYHEVSRDEKVDLSEFSYTTGYTMELIVGSGKQLDLDPDSNKRYIVRVYIYDEITENLQLEFYTQNSGAERTKLSYKETRTETYLPTNDYSSGEYLYISDTIVPDETFQSGSDIYLGIQSLKAKHPDWEILVYKEYTILGLSFELPLDNEIINQDMKQLDTGLKISYNGVSSVTKLNLYYSVPLGEVDGEMQYKIMDKTRCIINILSNLTDLKGTLFVEEDGKNVDVVYSSKNTSEQKIEKDENGNIVNLNVNFITDYMLTKEYSTKYEFIFKGNFMNGTLNRNSLISKIVLGTFYSLEEANNEPDIKDKILGDNAEGYKANYKDGITFTIFLTDGSSGIQTIKASEYYQMFEPEFFAAPIIGSKDPYIRLTGGISEGRNVDSYTIENGGVHNLDTYYGYGYHTILINDDKVNLSSLKPKFWCIDSDYFNLYKIDSDKKSILQDIKNPDSITETNQQYTLAWKSDEKNKHRNYWLSVVKKTTDGPKLFVNGPASGETREVLLTDYFENKHDVFIANTGNEPLYVSAKLSDDAKNVKLDDYWTVGGNDNQKLAAFTATSTPSDYSELDNVAKIRLLRPDEVEGDGAVSGELIIEASGGLVNGELDKNNKYYETYVIRLNDKQENPQIVNEKFNDPVLYVPYQSIVATDNKYEDNIVTYKLTGSLPDGITFNEETGEIYGVPQNTGIYNFTVQANFSKTDFESVEKEFSIIVKSNDDENVNAEVDDGFEIINRIPDIEITEGEEIEDQIFEFEYDYSTYIEEFQNVWLDGVKLEKDIDYVIEDGSTKITVKSQTISKRDDGKHTIAAEYRTKNNEVKKSTQNFNKKVNKNTPSPSPSPSPNPNPNPNPSPSPSPNKPSSGGGGGGSGTPSYTVSFEANGGSGVDAAKVKRNNKISWFATPVKPGYKFIGWYTDKELTKEFDKNTKVISNITLYAKYEPIQCNVWFNTNGGSAVNSMKIQGDTAIAEIPTPEKANYKFAGWYTDEALTKPFDENSKITAENTTLYAKWDLIIPDEAPEEAKGFIDVNESAWYYEDVNWAYNENLMIGYNNAIFAPNNLMTTSNIVTVLAKLSGDDLSQYNSSNAVSGIQENVWYTPYAKWAKDIAFIDGSNFNPNDKISREDMAVILVKFMDYINAEYDVSDEDDVKFEDNELISEKAKNALRILFKLGIFAGRGNDIIDPKSYLTRAEFAALIHRMKLLD